MNLSKIPEPSAEDLQFASIAGPYGMLVHEYEQTLAVLQESREHELTVMILAAEALLQKIRVIAHLLRHGRAMAFFVNIAEDYLEMSPEQRGSVEFFLQCGGEQ